MTADLQQVFLDTIDPNGKKRIAAEQKLETLRTNPQFILSLPKTYMASPNAVVAKISSIYYKNSVISQYSKSLCGHKRFIIDSIMEYMMHDPRNFSAHKEVLGHIFSVEPLSEISNILETMVQLAESNDENAFRVAITALKIFIEKDKIKYRSGESLDAVFGRMGPIILKKYEIYFGAKKYEFVKMIMSVFTLVHEGFFIPKFMNQIETFSAVIQMAINILKDLTDDVNNWQARYHASSFICKATNRSIKSYYKLKSMGEFLLESARLEEIYRTVKLIFNSKKDSKETIFNAIEFVLILASEKNFFSMIYDDIFFFIFEVILPSHVFSSEDQHDFKEQPEAYLNSKYNYYANDIRCSSGALFTEIINNVKQQPEVFSEIYNALFKIFIEHDNNGTEITAVQKYAALYLIVNITDSIMELKKDTVGLLITNVIYKDLDSMYPFLQSQCLYALQFFDGKMFENEYTAIALDRILTFMKSDSDILKVDAVLAIIYFMNCPSVQHTIKQNIQLIIQTLILMSNKFGIETLPDTLEMITSSYPDEISFFAPQLAETLSNNVITQLQKEEERIATISGFLRTISDLVLSLVEHKQILYQMYLKCKHVIFYILKNECADFYAEALDLISNFIYGFKEIENSMWELFQMVLCIEKSEIINVSEEMVCVIDNFITFGNRFMTPDHLDKIYNVVECLCIQEEDYLFDDDFICGCKIIESILLNMGYVSKDPQRVEFFISMVSMNYENIDDDTTTIVYALEVIMNCIIVSRDESLKALKKFDLLRALRHIYKYMNKFTRVHDKKVLLLYGCEMMKMTIEHANAIELDFRQLIEIILFAVKTLPLAIEKREKLKKQENENHNASYNENLNEEEEFEGEEELEEDLSFETTLDNFDIYGYCKTVFTSIQNESVGFELIKLMTDDEKQELSRLLS